MIMKFITSFLLITTTVFSMQQTLVSCETTKNTPSKMEMIAQAGYKYDKFVTPAGRVIDLVFIKHGSLMVDIDNYLVYIDPVKMYGNDFSVLPKSDLTLVTHEHHDHYDKDALSEISGDKTRLAMAEKVVETHGSGEVLRPNQVVDVKYGDGKSFTLTAVPAYNNTPEHLKFHPKENGNVGFVFEVDGMRIYVGGDTEDIAEMNDMKDIDVAFLPVNQPYTMTVEQAENAIEMLREARSAGRPGKLIIYPYHYGNTDLTPLVEKYKDSPVVEVRVREMQ